MFPYLRCPGPSLFHPKGNVVCAHGKYFVTTYDKMFQDLLSRLYVLFVSFLVHVLRRGGPQMGFIGTNMFMMAFTSYFFEGFVLVRVPFPLTNRFKVSFSLGGRGLHRSMRFELRLRFSPVLRARSRIISFF